jgi:hypothetical protein
MQHNGQKKAARLFSVAAIAGALLLTGCARTTVAGATDAGCSSYAEARLLMPRAEPVFGKWGDWIADLDDRLTGACR